MAGSVHIRRRPAPPRWPSAEAKPAHPGRASAFRVPADSWAIKTKSARRPRQAARAPQCHCADARCASAGIESRVQSASLIGAGPMRHGPTIAIVLVWLALMGTLVRREHAARGRDASTLPDAAELASTVHDAVDWFGVYQNDRKIGHARRQERRVDDGWVLEDEMQLALAMLGEPQTITTTLHAETDPDYALRRFRFVLVSPATTFAASGESDGMTLEVRYGADGRTERLALPLDEPVHLASSLRPRLAVAWPEPGARFT